MVHGGQMANQQKSDATEVSFLKTELEFWQVFLSIFIKPVLGQKS